MKNLIFSLLEFYYLSYYAENQFFGVTKTISEQLRGNNIDWRI